MQILVALNLALGELVPWNTSVHTSKSCSMYINVCGAALSGQGSPSVILIMILSVDLRPSYAASTPRTWALLDNERSAFIRLNSLKRLLKNILGLVVCE